MKTKLGKSAVSWGVWSLLWLCSTAGYAQNQAENTGGRCDTVRFVCAKVYYGVKFRIRGTEEAVFYVEADGKKKEYMGREDDWSDPYYGDTILLYSASPDGRLTYLDCCCNNLSSLDVSGCTALTYLDCYNNQLTSLDVSGCTALADLQCYNNQLTSLDVSGCTALGYLDCYNNQLTSLDVSGCTALGSLYCYNNQLTSLDLSDCTTLRQLQCYDNWLSELHFEGNEHFELYFYNNRLRLNVCYELFKRYASWSSFKGANQYIPVSLEVDEPYDLHADMELGGQRTEIRVTRKGGGYLDSKLYKVENDWLIFSERGEYTVEMTNSQVRNSGSLSEKIFVFLDIRVGMGDAPDDPSDPDNPSDPNDPDDPTAPDDPTNPDDPSAPDDPTKPGDTTANEALGVLTSAALQVYPNPATDVLHVALRASATGSAVHAGNTPHAAAPAASENLRTVRILSVGGHLYRSFTSGFESLPVGDLPAGIYLLEAETTAGTVLRQKFVKR